MFGLLHRFWSCVLNVAALSAVGGVMERMIQQRRSTARSMETYVRSIGNGLRENGYDMPLDALALEMLAGKVCARVADLTLQYMQELPEWAAVHSQLRNFKIQNYYDGGHSWWQHEDPDHEAIIARSPHAIASAAALDFARLVLADVLTSCPSVAAKITPGFGFTDGVAVYAVRLRVCIEFSAHGRRVESGRAAVSSSVDPRILRITGIAQRPLAKAMREAREFKEDLRRMADVLEGEEDKPTTHAREAGGGCGR